MIARAMHIAALMLLSAGAVAQTPHHQYHDVYENWLTRGGSSCCSNNDCGGAEGWRFGARGYEVRIGGEWHPVPPEAVRPYSSPDGNAHVCIWRGEIRCFVPGSGA